MLTLARSMTNYYWTLSCRTKLIFSSFFCIRKSYKVYPRFLYENCVKFITIFVRKNVQSLRNRLLSYRRRVSVRVSVWVSVTYLSVYRLKRVKRLFKHLNVLPRVSASVDPSARASVSVSNQNWVNVHRVSEKNTLILLAISWGIVVWL